MSSRYGDTFENNIIKNKTSCCLVGDLRYSTQDTRCLYISLKDITEAIHLFLAAAHIKGWIVT